MSKVSESNLLTRSFVIMTVMICGIGAYMLLYILYDTELASIFIYCLLFGGILALAHVFISNSRGDGLEENGE
jgi:hypothetical protein